MFYKLLLIFFLVSFQTTWAQQSAYGIEWLSNDPHLMLNDEISDVSRDSEGNLWIVSFSELIKYDGLEFKEIAIRNHEQSAFLRFEEDSLYGSYLFTASGEIFFIQSDSLVPYKNNFLIRSKVRSGMLVDWGFLENGNYYLTNASGSHIFEADSIKKIELLPEIDFPAIVVALEQNNANIFIKRDVKDDKGIISWPNNIILMTANNTSSNEWRSHNEHYHYAQDIVKSGNLFYFSSGTGHLFILDREGRLEKVDFEPTIMRLFVDSKSNLWISTKASGIHLIPEGDFSNPNRTIILENEFAIVSGEDYEGGIWGYQENKGVFRLKKSIFNYTDVTNKTDNINKVYTVKKYGKGLLISSQNTLYRYNLKTKKLEPKNFPGEIINAFDHSDRTVYSIYKEKPSNRFWLSRRGGILQLKNNDWKISKFHSNKYLRISTKFTLASQTFSNDITFKGFIYNFIISKSTKANSLVNMKKTSYQINDVITLNDSTFIWTKEGIYLAKNNDTTLLSEYYPKLDAGIADWEYFNNRLWISTTTGTYFLSDSLAEVKYEGRSIKNALLVPEHEKSIWIFSEDGSYNSMFYDSTKTTINKYFKIPNHIYTDFAVVDNVCFLGTKKNGMLSFNFNNLKNVKETSPILLMREIDLGSKRILKKDSTYSVDYFDNTLKIRYSGISYDSRLVNYRYLLEGFNQKWIETKDNFLQYTNIGPGEYIFRLQARKGNENWGEEQQFSFYIKPPFWYRWWFILTSLFIIVLLIIYVFKRRTEAINKEKSLHISRLLSEQKALRAKMDPHFIFNIISSLQYLVIDNKNEKALQFLEKFSSLMRGTLDQTNVDVTTLGSEIYFLREYIEMEQLRLENRFSFTIECDEKIDRETKIPNFIIQPFVENAIQHGLKNKVGNGVLSVSFARVGETILVVIEDDGVGYYTTQKRKQGNKGYISQGIKLVKDRLRLRDKKNEHLVEIIDLSELDEKKHGTRIEIKIKIEK